MLKKRINNCVARSARINLCRITFQFLGGILGSLLSLTATAGEIPQISPINLSPAAELVQHIQDRSDFKKRRDPFRPIQKRHSIPSSSRKSRPKASKATPVSTSKDPNWKLLGIVHGQQGRQAVIQVSPRERIFVSPGLELSQSGWIIKTISKGEVLLEHLSTSTSGKGRSRLKNFILSFPSRGNSH